jgi:hypothetical protein
VNPYTHRINPINLDCQVEIRKGVSLFHGSIPDTNPDRKPPPKRGRITGFSQRSRNRLRIQLFSLNEAPSHFITLTYPSVWPGDPAEWKRHLDNFTKALLHRFPGSWFFWKLEPQPKRKAPHYHLLGRVVLDGMPSVLFRSWLSSTWFRIVGSGDINHLRAGTQVKVVKDTSRRQLNYYVSKYLGKDIDLTSSPGWEVPGRFWGKFGGLPSSPSLVVDLDRSQYCQLRRLLRRWIRAQGRKSLHFSKRLAFIASFHVIIPWNISVQLIDFIT